VIRALEICFRSGIPRHIVVVGTMEYGRKELPKDNDN